MNLIHQIQSKLHRKMMVFFALVVTIPILIVAVVTLHAMGGILFETASSRMQQVLTISANEIDNLHQKLSSEIQLLLRSPELMRLILQIKPGGDLQRLWNEANQLQSITNLDLLEILDSEGEIISSAHWPAHFGYKNDWAKDQSREINPALSLRFETIQNERFLTLQTVRKIPYSNDLEEKFIILVVGFFIHQDFLSNLSRTTASEIILVDTDAKYKFSPSPSALNIPLTEVINQYQKENLINEENPKMPALLPLKIVQSRKQPVILGCLPLKNQDGELVAALILAQSYSSLKSLIARLQWIFVGEVLIGLILAWLGGFFVARWVSRPLEELTQGVQQFSKGHRQERLKVAATDEIGILVDSFNRMLEDLDEKQKRLIQAERLAAWRETARRLAHEIKNPLFPIQLSIEALKKGYEKVPEEFPQILVESTSTILRNVENLRHIVNEFTQFARMPAPQPRMMNLNKVVSSALSLFTKTSDKVNFHTDFDESLPAILGDPEQLNQVCLNLINNALEAMPDGGDLYVSTKLKKKLKDLTGSEFIELIFKDTGIGISEEEKEKIFNPYFSTKEKGMGLGLAIVWRIIIDHNAFISIESQKDHGATFIIKFPINSEI